MGEVKRKVPELRFSEFSGEWKNHKLSDVSIFLDGRRKPIKSSDRQKISGSIPYYGASGIIDFVNDYIFNEDIILLGEDGENILSRNLPLAFKVTGKCWVNNHAHVIKPNDKVDIDFLTQTLELINYSIYNTGTAQPKLNQQICRSIPFNLPTLPEQTKIANFLTAVDAKIANLSEEKSLLENYKKGVMQKIFSQQLRFKQDDGSDFPEWETKQLGSICKYYDGTHQTPKYVESGVPFYSVEHLTANQFTKTKFITEEVFEKASKRVVIEKGDILMTRIGSIGVARYIDWDIRASFYVSLALIKTKESVNSAYLAQFINAQFFQKELWKRTIHVAFPQKINLGEIGNCKVHIPTYDEQTKIANFLTSMDEKINTATEAIENAQTFKKGLLQQLFV